MRKPLALVSMVVAAAVAASPVPAAAPAAASATYTLSAKILAVKRGTTTTLTLRLYTATLGIAASGRPATSLAGTRRIRVAVTRQTELLRPGSPTRLTMRSLRRGQNLVIRATAPSGATGRSLFRATLVVITSR